MHLFELGAQETQLMKQTAKDHGRKQKCTREMDRTKQGINQKAIIPFSFLFIMKESWGRCIHVCSSADHKSKNVNSIFHHHHHPSCLIFFSFPSANKERKRGGQ
jgi:hypothetical protein